jgi:hypothetical protein
MDGRIIKWILQKRTGWCQLDLVQDRDWWWAVVNTVLKTVLINSIINISC